MGVLVKTTDGVIIVDLSRPVVYRDGPIIMTSYFFDGLLLLWAAVSFFLPSTRYMRIYLTSIASFGILLSLVYAFLLPGNPVWGYLSEIFRKHALPTGADHRR